MDMIEILIRFIAPILLPIIIYKILSYTSTAITYDRYDGKILLASTLIAYFFIFLDILYNDFMQYFIVGCFGFASLVSNARGSRTASLTGVFLGLYLLGSASYKDANEKDPCQQSQPQSTELQKINIHK